MALSHSLMIARGDLGVELGHERTPIAQKLIAAAARKAGLEPVICATMMMESMIESPVPTRAEVRLDSRASDVGRAVWTCLIIRSPTCSTPSWTAATL
jgi:pyruvate kinase